MTIQQRIQSAVIILVVTALVVYATRDWNQTHPEAVGQRAYAGVTGETMGTTYSIKYYTSNKSQTTVLIKKSVDELLQNINRQMSTYDPESELSLFNSTDSTDWFDVSHSTAQVVAKALETAELSEGKFDPTVGPLVKLWNFGPDREKFEVPHDDVIESHLNRIGYQKMKVRFDPPALKKSDPEIYLDLSAIAKGYAVDQVSELLIDLGLKSYLVEIGGEMRCVGGKPDGKLWTLAIEKPTEGMRDYQKVFEASDCAIATSGNYRNYYIEKGKRFSHTIDPVTGRPVEHQLASATVLANNCTVADAYATTLMVLGPEDGYNWAIQNQVAALFLVFDDGKIFETATPEFDRQVGKE